MKHAIVTVLLLTLCAAVALAAGDKQPDTQDYVMQAQSRIQITGAFTESSPVWDRGYGFGDPAPETCDYGLTAAFYQGQYYDMFCVTSTDANPVEFVVSTNGTTLDDTTLHLFCADFDPTMPLAECVYYDDDGGEGLYSAITVEDGVILTPDTEYWLVISNYGVGDDGDMGDFVIDTSDNVELCGGVAVQSTDWSSIKGLFE